MPDVHARGQFHAGYDDGFVRVTAQFLKARLHCVHQALGRPHVNPGGIQLAHVHEGRAACGNFLLPEFTYIEFAFPYAREGSVAVPRHAGERRGGAFRSTEPPGNARQATVSAHPEGVHLREVHRKERYLRAVF